jgi:cytochrome P450
MGTQACPGRFFAAHEARVVVGRILLNYDFKLKKPHPNGPMDVADGVMTTVDAGVEFLFKRRDPDA